MDLRCEMSKMRNIRVWEITIVTVFPPYGRAHEADHMYVDFFVCACRAEFKNFFIFPTATVLPPHFS
jgi:hypothetical protein